MTTKKATPSAKRVPAMPVEAAFAEVVALIEQARTRAYQTVSNELVGLYWQIGEYISRKLETAEWGEGVVDGLRGISPAHCKGSRGFTRSNLFRMRQFYESYARDKKVAPLARQLPWTHNLIILEQSKRSEEREFYVRKATRLVADVVTGKLDVREAAAGLPEAEDAAFSESGIDSTEEAGVELPEAEA